MAAPQYNTEELIANIKRRCLVPTSQLTYTDPQMTLLANDELQGEVVPLIMSTREEYFVDFVDVPSPSDGLIDFPVNAIGSKLRNVSYLSQTSPLVIINLPRIDLDVVAGIGFYNYATLAGFYVKGNQICLYPNTSVPTNTNIRIYFYKRSLSLAAPTAYGQVVTVDALSNTVTLDQVPLNWAIGTQINTVEQGPNFSITCPLATVTAKSSPTLILDTVEGISVGDYMSEYGYSAIPQIPLEAHAYLAQLTAAKLLEGLGDRDGMTAALQKALSLKDALLVMVSNRVDGSPKKVMNPDGGLRLRNFRRGWWGW